VFSLSNFQPTNFYEIWYGRCADGVHPQRQQQHGGHTHGKKFSPAINKTCAEYIIATGLVEKKENRKKRKKKELKMCISQ
jgi:hypothetical protein